MHPEVASAVAQAVRELEALGAIVEQVDPGIEDPLDICTGLWFVGAWSVWNTLDAQQQAVTDPDFRAEAQLGAEFSALDVQRLNMRRGALGSHMRQFMQRYDLLVTPSVAVPAFDARPAGHMTMTPQAMLGWTPFSYPFNLTQQPACSIPCGLTTARPADRPAVRRADVRRRAGAARRARLRAGETDRAAAAELNCRVRVPGALPGVK